MRNTWRSQWRSFLLNSNGLTLLSLIGIGIGVVASLLITGFMALLDLVFTLMHGDQSAGFSGYSAIARFLLPFGGALALLALYRLAPTNIQDVGLTHVIDRLQRGRGKLPLANAWFQAAAAATALSAGFSVGKEGPAVHIGSALASKVGRTLYRSPSQLRLLTGCGTAAAISAAFGTPLAGVMFAMEVVLMEYSLTGFIPIIAASVTATAGTQMLLGETESFLVVALPELTSLPMPWVLATGVFTGLIAMMLHRIVRWCLALNFVHRRSRFLTAAFITGCLGMVLPQVMGLGYDTMNHILLGQFSIGLLAAILVGKLVATGVAVGFGIPAGVVAPALFTGLAAGALVGSIVPGADNDAYFALIGMAGVMSALLHAPLAALTAVLELTLNAEMMFPTMIVVVLASLTCQVIFHKPSLLRTLLSARGLEVSTHPLRNALASRFLTEIATVQFTVIAEPMDEDTVAELLANPHRLLVFRYAGQHSLVSAQSMRQQMAKWLDQPDREKKDFFAYLAKAVPERCRLAILTEDISLLEAIKVLQSDDVVALQVPLDEFRIGLVTRAKLSSVLTTEGELLE